MKRLLQARCLSLVKTVKLTNKIKPFCYFLEYNELYCEQDLAEYLETEPGKPY